jgi:hypothetical protein
MESVGVKINVLLLLSSTIASWHNLSFLKILSFPSI